MSRRVMFLTGVVVVCAPLLWFVYDSTRRAPVTFVVEPGNPPLSAEILDRRDVAVMPPFALTTAERIYLREGWMKIRLSSPARLSETAYFFAKNGQELQYAVGLRGQVISSVEVQADSKITLPSAATDDGHAPVVADVDGDGEPERVTLEWQPTAAEERTTSRLAVVVRDARTGELRWREDLVRYAWAPAHLPARLLLGPEMRPHGGRTLIVVSVGEERSWREKSRFLYYDVLRGSDGLRMVTRRHRLASEDVRTCLAPLRWGPRGADGWPTVLVCRADASGQCDLWQLHVTSGRIACMLTDVTTVEIADLDGDGIPDWAVYQRPHQGAPGRLTRLRGEWPVVRHWLEPVGAAVDLEDLPKAENPYPSVTLLPHATIERRLATRDDDSTATSFVPHPVAVDRRISRPLPWCPGGWTWGAIALRATLLALAMAVALRRWLARRWWHVLVGTFAASVLVLVVFLVEDAAGMERGEKYSWEGWWIVLALGSCVVGVARVVVGLSVPWRPAGDPRSATQESSPI